MKKILSFILTLAMVMGLTVMTAFAANGIEKGGTDTAEVKGTYKPAEAAENVYSVDIAWGDLSFTYNGAFDGTWDPTEHKYENGTEAGWADGQGTITITNHSNTGITATPSYTPSNGYESANMTFNSPSLSVSSADNGVNGAAGTAVSGTITVTPTGSLPEETSQDVIGTITITIQ